MDKEKQKLLKEMYEQGRFDALADLEKDGKVIISMKEYEKVKYVLKYEPEEAIIRLEDLTKNERLYSPHMFCSLGGCSGVRKGCNRTCKESWIVIERKETAEKIYLQAKAIIDSTKHIVQGREYLHIDALKEIIKQFGVDLGE